MANLSLVKSDKPKPIDVQKEYVAGGYTTSSKFISLIESRGTKSLKPEQIDEMLLDPEVSAALWLLVYSVFADGITISPSVSDSDPNYAKAIEISESFLRALSAVPKIKLTLGTMLFDALARGHKVAEQTYYYAKSGMDAGRLMIGSIKPKPRQSVAFVVDQFSNHIGFLYARPGTTVIATSLVTDLRDVLPREKFVVLNDRCVDSDPRGTSYLESARDFFTLKKSALPQYAKWMERFADASMVGKTAPGAGDEEERDENNNVVTDAEGFAKTITAQQAMLNQLIRFKGASAIAIPDGADVKILEVHHEGEQFIKAIEICNQQIARSILLQTLATQEGKHQARASSETQMNVLDWMIQSIKDNVAETIQTDIGKPFTAYNWGEDAARDLCPKVSLGDGERRNWATDADAAAKWIATGELSQSQIDSLVTSAGIPARKENEKSQREEKQESQPQEKKQ